MSNENGPRWIVGIDPGQIGYAAPDRGRFDSDDEWNEAMSETQKLWGQVAAAMSNGMSNDFGVRVIVIFGLTSVHQVDPLGNLVVGTPGPALEIAKGGDAPWLTRGGVKP